MGITGNADGRGGTFVDGPLAGPCAIAGFDRAQVLVRVAALTCLCVNLGRAGVCLRIAREGHDARVIVGWSGTGFRRIRVLLAHSGLAACPAKAGQIAFCSVDDRLKDAAFGGITYAVRA